MVKINGKDVAFEQALIDVLWEINGNVEGIAGVLQDIEKTLDQITDYESEQALNVIVTEE